MMCIYMQHVIMTSDYYKYNCYSCHYHFWNWTAMYCNAIQYNAVHCYVMLDYVMYDITQKWPFFFHRCRVGKLPGSWLDAMGSWRNWVASPQDGHGHGDFGGSTTLKRPVANREGGSNDGFWTLLQWEHLSHWKGKYVYEDGEHSWTFYCHGNAFAWVTSRTCQYWTEHGQFCWSIHNPFVPHVWCPESFSQ